MKCFDDRVTSRKDSGSEQGQNCSQDEKATPMLHHGVRGVLGVLEGGNVSELSEQADK